MVKLRIKFKGRKVLVKEFPTLKKAKAIEKLVRGQGTKTEIIYRRRKYK